MLLDGGIRTIENLDASDSSPRDDSASAQDSPNPLSHLFGCGGAVLDVYVGNENGVTKNDPDIAVAVLFSECEPAWNIDPLAGVIGVQY